MTKKGSKNWQFFDIFHNKNIVLYHKNSNHLETKKPGAISVVSLPIECDKNKTKSKNS